jgi:hypothetical protein
MQGVGELNENDAAQAFAEICSCASSHHAPLFSSHCLFSGVEEIGRSHHQSWRGSVNSRDVRIARIYSVNHTRDRSAQSA